MPEPLVGMLTPDEYLSEMKRLGNPPPYAVRFMEHLLLRIRRIEDQLDRAAEFAQEQKERQS